MIGMFEREVCLTNPNEPIDNMYSINNYSYIQVIHFYFSYLTMYKQILQLPTKCHGLIFIMRTNFTNVSPKQN